MKTEMKNRGMTTKGKKAKKRSVNSMAQNAALGAGKAIGASLIPQTIRLGKKLIPHAKVIGTSLLGKIKDMDHPAKKESEAARKARMKKARFNRRIEKR